MGDHRDIRPTAGWLRVSRARPCPICGRDSWCAVSRDGAAAICPRTPAGAARDLGAAGYLHRLRDDRPPRSRPRPAHARILRRRDGGPGDYRLGALARAWADDLDARRLGGLARALGLSADSLLRLGVGWSPGHRAWSFPMVDEAHRVLGIRLRGEGGRKFAVRGGHDGLFLAGGPTRPPLLVVAEGATDTAALWDLGFEAAGRPSCRGAAALLERLLGRVGPAQVAIAADADPPGRAGARALAARLALRCRDVRVFEPPPGRKDIRAWMAAGAAREDVLAAIDAARPWRVPILPGPRPATGGKARCPDGR